MPPLRHVLPLLLGSLLFLVGSLCPSQASATLRELLASEGFDEAEIFREGNANAAFVKVEINGHPLVLCIDTGSPMTLLSREAAARANVPTHRPYGPISGVNGLADPKAAIASLRSFKIAGKELAAEPILISDAAFPRRKDGFQYDGLLGWTTMKRNHVIFGYSPALFFFRADGKSTRKLDAACRAEDFTPVRLRPRQGGYYLSLKLDGTPARMLLDSGASFTFLNEDFSRLHLGKTEGKVSSVGVDGNPILQERVLPKTMEIGTRSFPPITITTGSAKLFDAKRGPQLDGLLGYDLMGQFYTLLDMGNDRLYLHPREKAAVPVAFGAVALDK